MLFVLVLLLPLPVAFALAALLQKKFEETIGPVFLGLIAVGYFFALFGLVWLAPYVLLAAVLGACVYLVFALFIRRKTSVFSLLSPGLVAFLLFAVVLWWLCRGRMLVFWDDFSHWGLTIKNMYYLNDLYTAPASVVIFKDYPPATAILEYIFLKAVHAPFREDVVLFTNGLFCLSLLVYPLHRFRWKRAGLAFVCAALLFIVPVAINAQNYTRLLVDGLMGVLLAYILLVCFMESKGWYATICCMLGCFVLSITKAAGAGLAAMAALVVLLSVLLLDRADWKARWKQQKVFYILQTGGPLLATVLGTLSWSAHKSLLGITASKAAAPVLGGLIEMLRGNAPVYRYEVAQNFLKTFFTTAGTGTFLRFPSVVWLLVYAALFAGAWLLSKKEARKRVVFFFVSVVLVHLLFMLSLLLSYLFAFSRGEALLLAAYFRYEGTAATMGMLFALGIFLVAAQEKKLWVRLASGALACACVFLSGSDSISFLQGLPAAPIGAAQTQHERYLSLQSASRVAALGEETPRVFLVSITDDGWALLRLNYELLPITLSEMDYHTSIATGLYYGEDTALGSDIYSPEEWAEVLDERFDYVYLYNIDGRFTTNYRSLFEDEDDIVNDTMLAVVRHDDGSISLRRVDIT